MSEATNSDEATDTRNGSAPDDRHRLDDGGDVRTQFADASVVEFVGDTVQITFLERARRVSGAVWPRDRSQPSQVALADVVGELARLRLTTATANDLAMNLLLELAQEVEFDIEAFDRNIVIIRSALLENREEGP